jgi:nitrite reductase/ring-hydroxylating ferredoxin subunit
MSEAVRICSAHEVPIEGAKLVSFQGREISLINHQQKFYAVENYCPHMGGPLGLGWIKNGIITCPWHRFRFHLQTGRSLTNPAMSARMYPVAIEDGNLVLTIDLTPGQSRNHG